MNYFKNLVLFLVILLLSFYSRFSSSQVSYCIYVDSVMAKVSPVSINKFNRQLSGDTITLIGGQPFRITSRQWNNESNTKAAQYIYEKLQSFGLQVQYNTFSSTGVNVLAQKTGTKYPNQKLIICAHYDDMISFGPPSDTVPGADDNASGICGVLETARIFSTMDLDYTVIFAAWDEEERGLYGSKAYADSAFVHGDSIIGVLNMDMIAWDQNNDSKFQITTNDASISLANGIYYTSLMYLPSLLPQVHIGSYGSDQISFNNRGYLAVAVHEDNNDFTPYYHTIDDKYSTLNKPYLFNIIKAVTGVAVITLKDYKIYFTHTQIASTNDTTSIITKAIIKSSWKVAKDGNKPRLYYKVGTGNFNFVTAQSNNLDTFYFSIPGQPKGSTVYYYLAAQDSLGTMIGSYPEGAKGISPPGTIPPQTLFVYHINKLLTINSNTTPKTIGPKQIVYDTLTINEMGMLSDINLNFTIYHSNDSDLYVYLIREGASQTGLTTKNGGSGDNYINTTLDDEAIIPISQGSAPFTGSYKPQQNFFFYKDKDMRGKWVIKIFNNSNTVTGQLISWSISAGYYNPIGIQNITMPVNYSLSQNYPNPFNPNTRIEFSVIKESDVKIIVFDILGREVSTLINDKLKYGNYNISFNGADLSSGMYFYSMYVDGALFSTKKMMLLK
jgi:hypothetical protein